MNIFYQFANTIAIKQGAVVLTYHSLSRSTSSYTVRPSTFRKQMLSLKSNYDFISLDELVSGYERHTVPSGVALTFDDGYQNILPLIPFLREQGIPVTIFVLSLPDRANRTELDNREKLLTKKQLRYLLAQGVTIGCHSATHPNIKTLNFDQIYKEITIAKNILEQTLDAQVDYFAYPKGLYTTDVIQAVKYADYRAGFAINNDLVTSKSNQWLLPRIIIDASYTPENIPLRIGSGVQAVRRLQHGNPWRYSL